MELEPRMKQLETQMVKLEKDVEYLGKEMGELKVEIHDISNKTDKIHKRLDEWKEDIHKHFVPKEEYIYFRNIVMGTVIAGTVSAVLIIVIQKLIN